MKRTLLKPISAAMSIFILAGSMIISAFAFDAEKTDRYYYSTLTVDGEETSFLENEYYKVYADYYGKYFYDSYTADMPAEKIDKALYESIIAQTGERYITVVMNSIGTDGADIAKTLGIAEDEVIAVCKSYPVAMLKITSDKTDGILSNENTAAVYNAFPSAVEPTAVNCSELEEIYTPSAADARRVLRYSAKLEKAPENMAEGKKFFFMSDADLDGKITSADARIALRISARLENGKTYFKNSSGCNGFWEELG